MSGVPRPLVIGAGNPDRGDDGVGPAVARLLRESGSGAADVVAVRGEATGLLDLFTDRDHVIIVDACVANTAAGEILRYEAAAQPLPADIQTPSTHGFGVAAAIELARALGQLPRRVTVLAIVCADFTAGAGLSPAVAAAAERTARMIAEIDLAAGEAASAGASRPCRILA